MRCPKCGKMLDLQTTACPVCKTRIPADRHTAPSRFTPLSQPTSTQFIPPQPAPSQFTPPPQPAPTQFIPLQLAMNQFMPPPHNKFCPTCGTALYVNSTFCPRCGSSTHYSRISQNTGGINANIISYFVYVLIGTNLILAFTSLIKFISRYFDPASPHGSHTETYSFWYISSAFWNSYNLHRAYSIGTGQDKYLWPIFLIIIMYLSIAVCAFFVLIALYKAYIRISSNDKSIIPILKPLIIATIAAIIQLFSLNLLRSAIYAEGLSLTVWFWLFAILAGFSLVAEIFLIKANGTSDKGYI